MAESREDYHAIGYEDAVNALFDTKSLSRADRTQLLGQVNEGFAVVRRLIDAQDDSLDMSRAMAMFYLDMSPGVFQKHRRRNKGPFKDPRGGATKGEVTAWFASLMSTKHHVVESSFEELSRSVKDARPYFVTKKGEIVSDGAVGDYRNEDVLRAVAHAIEAGGSIRIMTLAEALERPWIFPEHRRIWGGALIRSLEKLMAVEPTRSD